jgi:CRP-like cAMP-binding protein
MAKAPHWTPTPKLTCLHCKTAKSAEWCALAENGLQLIDNAKVTCHYQVGEFIYRQGEVCTGIYCIESGVVGIRVSDADGNSKMVYTVESGQTLGYGDYFGTKRYGASAHCLQEATICQVPAEALRQAMHHNSALGLAFLSHGAEDLQRAHASSAQQALYSVRTRLSHLLLGFKDAHGTSDADGSIVIALPFTWHEAAELIGARPETVSRSLQALSKDKVLHTEGRRVIIPDLDLLLDEIEAPVD